MSPERLDNVTIPPGGKYELSFCGSATYEAGVKGHLDLCHDNNGPIASLYWNGPWTLTDNQFDVVNLNSEEYTINASPIQETGILGDVSVIVSQPH